MIISKDIFEIYKNLLDTQHVRNNYHGKNVLNLIAHWYNLIYATNYVCIYNIILYYILYNQINVFLKYY